MAINSVGNSNFLLGQSIVVWRDGKVVWLKPHEI